MWNSNSLITLFIDCYYQRYILQKALFIKKKIRMRELTTAEAIHRRRRIIPSSYHTRDHPRLIFTTAQSWLSSL
jgi:hypothetical protein